MNSNEDIVDEARNWSSPSSLDPADDVILRLADEIERLRACWEECSLAHDKMHELTERQADEIMVLRRDIEWAVSRPTRDLSTADDVRQARLADE